VLRVDTCCHSKHAGATPAHDQTCVPSIITMQYQTCARCAGNIRNQSFIRLVSRVSGPSVVQGVSTVSDHSLMNSINAEVLLAELCHNDRWQQPNSHSISEGQLYMVTNLQPWNNRSKSTVPVHLPDCLPGWLPGCASWPQLLSCMSHGLPHCWSMPVCI